MKGIKRQMSSSGTIQINESTFNEAVKDIEKANKRTEGNNENITVKYEKCNMTYLDEYISTIERLKTTLMEYYDLLVEDINNLRTVRDNFKEVDK